MALDGELRLARRAQAATDLHAVAESLRFLAGAEMRSTHDLEILESHCRIAWAARASVGDRTSAALDPATEEQVRKDLLDLALLWADLKRRLAQRTTGGEARSERRSILAEAEALLGPSAVLARERQLLGDAPAAASPLPGAGPSSSWEYTILAQSSLRRGELEQAAQELECAIDLRPQDFWANFYRGVCAYRRQQYGEAVHSFGVCTALAPTSPECYYNRGLAQAAWGKKRRAMADYDRALTLAPDLVAAKLNRGVLNLEEGKLTQARTDLEQALGHGADPAMAHYNLALVHAALGDRAAARRHLEQVLRYNPTHAGARTLKEQLGPAN
jgi:tetratricopeptide (TPR) repeat protein